MHSVFQQEKNVKNARLMFEVIRYVSFMVKVKVENRFTNGGKVVNLTRRPHFTHQEDSWCSFLLEAESTPGP
jgi:hypothetical protein